MEIFILITVTEYKKLNNHTFGLGQDVAHDLTNLAKVASLFIYDSKINKWLRSERLNTVVSDEKIRKNLYNAINKINIKLTHLQLGGKRTKSEANSLVQAIFDGQGKRLAIVDWAAQNYVSVTVAFGLIKFERETDSYKITDLGKLAVELYDNGQKDKLNEFFYERLLEYPYASWLLRLTGSEPSKRFSKFDLGMNFGFIDELGFSTAPLNIYLDNLAQAEIDNDPQLRKETKSNFESTGDKYMRWLAGVLVHYKLLNSQISTKTVHNYLGTDYELSIGTTYQITGKGLRALNQANGKSKYSRSIKRVMWEYFAPKAKDAIRKKTVRALIIKYLSESPKGKSATDISKFINNNYPSLETTPEEIIDDTIGLNRIGIEISIEGENLLLKEKLFPFDIPIKQNVSFVKEEIDILKDKLRKQLKLTSHTYLKGIDIAFKKRTTNAENTEFESISVSLFTKEMSFFGHHLGGASKPDGIVWNNDFLFILDSKAYHQGFPLTKNYTDPMLRYLTELEARNPKVIPNWWDMIPKDIDNKYFVYVSGKFKGNYLKLLNDFKIASKHDGGALEFIKLLLLTENFKSGLMTVEEIKEEILGTDIGIKSYYPKLAK